MKIWQKKYQLNKQIENYTVGNDYLLDQKLLKYDCKASIAHAKMLQKLKILTKNECDKIVKVLNEIIKKNEAGSFVIEKQDEDCHTAIENYLVKNLGKIGKKIHYARSRNDQVLTALRLYYKDEIKNMINFAEDFIQSLDSFKEKYGHIEIPGYTHMKKAMPSSIGLWCDAFIDSMHDNKKLLQETFQLIDQSPLGTGAGYGLPIEIDRKYTAQLLGFKNIQKNPIYAQNSRGKFESTIIHALNQIMFDLNKFSSDILLFSMSEIGYLNLSPEVCTGSSIMPHKKNPDVLEILRANYYKILSFEFQIKTIIGNLPSGYNRDLQLTKEPIIEGFEITKNSLQVTKIVINNIQVNQKKCKKAMTKELYSTKETYDLVKQGAAFRDAYNQISKNYE